METNTEGTQYTDEFFDGAAAQSEPSAREILPLVTRLINVRSAVDVGCGVGHWLRALESMGVSDYVGVDGSYLDPARLRIPPSKFRAADLKEPLRLGRRFDLALCLEVAEHLPTAAARPLVASLCAAADVIVFSAAIPFQSGTNHINLQWPRYWASLFDAESYECLDCIRPHVWHKPDVAWWFAQNALLYVRRDIAAASPSLSRLAAETGGVPASLVHPVHFEMVAGSLARLRDLRDVPRLPVAFAAAAKSLSESVRHRIGRRGGQ